MFLLQIGFVFKRESFPIQATATMLEKFPSGKYEVVKDQVEKEREREREREYLMQGMKH
jgi:hypothetical protein